jgi:isopenicillin-N epimerase
MASAKEPEGYKAFGSFHTASVEEMLAIPDEEWTRPSVPFSGECEQIDEVCSAVRVACEEMPEYRPEGLDEASAALVGLARGDEAHLPLGPALKTGKAYLTDPSWCFVNHGAFGGALAAGVRTAHRWQEHCEAQPLRFIDRELFPHVVHSLRCMAECLSFDPACPGATKPRAKDVVFLPNATTGLNTAIQAAPLSPERPAFTLSICYGALKKMLTHACDRAGARLILLDTPFPPPAHDKAGFDDWIVGLYEKHLPEGAGLAVIDAVTSNTALVLPVERVAAVCAAKGVPLLVDGAHALGSTGGCGPDTGATWYVTNCHKWWSSPRGLAAMWVHPDWQSRTRPLIVSHGYGSGFSSEFIWDGCRDYSAALSVPAVCAMRARMGEARLAEWSRALLRWAVAHLCTAWGTDTPVDVEVFSHMALVRVPDSAVWPSGRGGAATSSHAKELQDALHDRFKVECPVKCLGGYLFVRISVAPYNWMDDYRRLGEAVSSIRW